MEEVATISCLLGVSDSRHSKALILLKYIIPQADRVSGPPREDLPLPTQAPYTAFVGNLAFDLTEIDLEEFFAGQKVRFIKDSH